jgi:dienelactone hydrolase
MHLTQPIGATGILLVWVCALTLPAVAQESPLEADGVTVDSDGWQLVGDLTVPAADDPIPAVLMLNQAAGDRVVYAKLARHLADRGIASLRLDLRGHGESTNLGVFTPGEHRRDPLIWDAEVDVAAAHAYLKADPRLDAGRIGIVGASYSGEEMAEAGRLNGYAQAYVALSPGSFEDLSIAGIDASGVPWLFVVSRDERFLQEITVAVREQSTTVEMVVVPGQRHASDLLVEHPDLSERVAVWLAHHLQ